MYSDLRNYLQKYHNQLTWKERFYIARKIISALRRIHDENAIHRDLHSGNILYSPKTNNWYISDLGFCGPANKPLESIYGSLPYLAPEVICGNKTTKASDVYSIAILMWEISSGQPPFINYEIDNNLAENIVNGIRPKIISDTPLEYMNLMVQCWDADPLKRPRIRNLQKRLREIDLSYQGIPYESFQLDTMGETSNTNTYRRLFTSKVYRFENFLEPKNATEVEQEEFYSKLHDFCIPDDLDDINKPNNQENDTLIESNNSEAM
ncbi:kinase-like protein [Rhizophagus irregularis]|uniref:Kinase-like protein n=3 Tax=Rhizophagus irregularis TaxID=588596 RepID=A0A2N0R1H4_9GLOM|nr:kinase-like protein [Rhizophagus irregularis]